MCYFISNWSGDEMRLTGFISMFKMQGGEKLPKKKKRRMEQNKQETNELKQQRVKIDV